MSTRDDAGAALAAAEALHADAAAREARAAKARAEADAALSKASTAHVDALAASAEKPADDRMIDAAARAAIRAQHAQAGADKARKAHEAVAGEVAEFAGRVDRARTAVRRAEIEARRAARLEALRVRGVHMAQHTLALQTLAVQTREDLAADEADAAELVRLGVATLPSDGLPIAHGAASTFFSAGAGPRQVEETTRLRHVLSALQPRYPAAGVYGMLAAFVDFTTPIVGPFPHRPAVEAELAAWEGRTHFGQVSAEKEETRQRELAARVPHLAPTVVTSKGPEAVHLRDASRPAIGGPQGARQMGSR
jgi:hypothetical protein